jgi:pimeloyl-ACP methyl ester carboxylesterase
LFVKTFVPSLFYEKNIPPLKQLVERLRDKAAQTQASAVIEYARAMRDRESSVEMIKNIKAPVMFIIGEEDGSIPLDKSLEQAILPANSHILRLAETGHMGMFEKPDETNRFVERFLKFC